jgi:hypothetical protein
MKFWKKLGNAFRRFGYTNDARLVGVLHWGAN